MTSFTGFRARGLAVVITVALALSGTGLPCLLSCLAEAAYEHNAPCHDDNTPCNDGVLCGSDPAPAVVTSADGPAPLLDLGIVLAPASLPSPAPRPGGSLQRFTLPDRSPPIPPGFVVLRI